jgi:hypothetical protein
MRAVPPRTCAGACLPPLTATRNSPFRLPESAELALCGTTKAAPQARQFAVGVLHKWGVEELGEDCALAISELVANSVKAASAIEPNCRACASGCPASHQDALIILRLSLTAAQILAEVWDVCELPPVPAVAADLDEGGRGLLLVSAFSSAWNWYPAPHLVGGKVTWAAFSLPSTPPGDLR